MKPYIPSSDEEYFQRLVSEAPYLEGWHTNTETLDDIEWLDRALLTNNKDFFYKNRNVLAASSGIVALFGIPMRNLSLPFMSTGTLSVSSEKNVKRVIKHVTHFSEWFTHGIFDKSFYDDIKKIKRMHNYLAKNMKAYEPPADEEHPDRERLLAFREALKLDFGEMEQENAFAPINTYKPKFGLSQFDLVMIQMDFVSPVYTAETHGIKDEEGLRGLIHHWAVVGRLLGIEDRFNIALHPSPELFFRILRNTLPLMETMDLTLVQMFESYLEGFSMYFHLPASPAAILYAMTAEVFPDFKGMHLRNMMSVMDKIVVMAAGPLLKIVHTGSWLKDFIFFSVTKMCSLASIKYHKLSREDKLKFPAEVFA